MILRVLPFFGLIFVLCNPVSAELVINFQDLESSGSGSLNHGGTYTSGEYLFSSDPVFETPRFSTYETDHSRYVGSTALREFYANAETTLTRLDNESFSMISIALGELDVGDAADIKTIEFRGEKSDSSTVTQTFNLGSVTSGVFDLETFFFSDEFQDVVSVSWTQGVGATGTAFQFDDITVTIPEPSGLSLIAALVTGAVLRRKRRATAS